MIISKNEDDISGFNILHPVQQKLFVSRLFPDLPKTRQCYQKQNERAEIQQSGHRLLIKINT
jgi:hypothetical protein